MNKQNKNRLIDTENKLVVARWERGWGMGGKAEGIRKHALPVIKAFMGM